MSEEHAEWNSQFHQVYDSLDLDLLVKVMSSTVFSPFFTFFVPLIFKAQGVLWTHPIVLQAAGWCAFTCVIWLVRFTSQIYRNGSSIFIGPPRLDWGEQIVLITGGASGVGALLANTLAVRNVTVIVLDLRPLVTENYNITSYICDVSNWDQVESVHKKIVDEIGHPTIIVNNAGVVQGKLLLDLSKEDLSQTFGVNVLAQFFVLKAFLPELIKQNVGHVISVSSVMGLIGASRMTDYCASKASLISLNESLRYELDKKYNAPNVRTTLVLPGHIATPMFSSFSLRSHPFVQFFAPTLSTHTVAKAIIAAIDGQFSTTIQLPFYVHFVPYLTLMPSYVRDFAQWFTGADSAMDNFVKVSGKREGEKSEGKSEGKT